MGCLRLRNATPVWSGRARISRRANIDLSTDRLVLTRNSIILAKTGVNSVKEVSHSELSQKIQSTMLREYPKQFRRENPCTACI